MSTPTSIVIFGASGDLTRRKLIPALRGLAEAGALPECWEVIGFGRHEMSDEAFRASLEPEEGGGEGWRDFAQRLHYQHGGYADPEGYEALGRRLDAFEEECGVEPGAGNRLYYLATPPDVFPRVAEALAAAGLERGGGWRRLIVEKPFGTDLESARTLNERLLRVFREDQIFRIDHYLGKETVQNILAFRLGNGIFEPLWRRQYVDHVQIVVAERLGIEGRGGYYDRSGALRDMVENHLLQLLALTAMEPPGTFTADAVRNEKVKVLQCIRPLTPEEMDRCVVRGQYRGYREEEGVAPDSRTETYVALRLSIDTWRWAGVPFFLRTGKELAERRTEISIQFRQPPLTLFASARGSARAPMPSVLTLRIQPDEGISLRVGMKPPGAGMRLEPVELGFSYAERFGDGVPDAYARLLLDALAGDATLFIRRDEAEAAWRVVTPILEHWAESDGSPEPYEPGSWGPPGADSLVGDEGCAWRLGARPEEGAPGA